jgi:hypothetical protein
VPLGIPPPDVSFPLETSAGTVLARLRKATSFDIQTWERTWKPRLKAAGELAANWDWAEQVVLAAEPGHECLALAHVPIRLRDRMPAILRSRIGLPVTVSSVALDGLIALSVTGDQRSRISLGEPLVYVEWLGSAPHNRKAFGPPLIERVSNRLLEVAITASRELGYFGRIGLHSKPDSERVYRKIGMTPGEREKQPDGEWLYFEGVPEWADAFFPKERTK